MINIKQKELYMLKQKVLGSTSDINDIVMCLGPYNSYDIYIFFNLRTTKKMMFSIRNSDDFLISLRDL